MNEFSSICRLASTLLSEALQSPLHLEVLEQFTSNHIVLRCSVQRGELGGSVPKTVIVKQRNVGQPPAEGDFDQSILFANEWASLDFMTRIAGDSAPVPRLLASERQTGLVVLQDLGSVFHVQDLMYGDDRQAAVTALLDTGSLLGQLQSLAYGREPEFIARQKEAQAETTVSDASRDLRGDMPMMRACLDGLEIRAGDRFEVALQDLEEAIHGPGPFRTFVHNDAGLHNFAAAPDGVKLFDFEFAGYGHGLLDVVCARLAYPPAFRGRISPPEVVAELEARYRNELAARIPELDDANRFGEALAQASAHWAFSKLLGFWNAYLRERLIEGETRDTRGGRSPERAAFFRRQVFTYLRLALASLDEEDRLPELRHTLAGIVDRLLAIWPGTPLFDTYPVFGGEPWHYP